MGNPTLPGRDTVPYIATSIHTICSTRSTLPSLPSMAKSLRSKSKRAFRRVKREDPKSDYAIRDKIRLQRLNDKLKVLTPVDRSDDEDEMQEDKPEGEAASSAKAKPANSTTTGAASVTKDGMATEAADMTEGDVETGKISTSGPRTSSRTMWRKAKNIPDRTRTEKNSTTFGHKKSYKSSGKAAKGGRRKR